jgi:hypothetical protein
MKKIMAVALIGCALLLGSWGFKGHQAVATIAENHLTPQAKAGVQELLGTQKLSDISSWADEVLSEESYKNTANWHYANLPLGLNYDQFSQAIKSQAANIYTALAEARVVLTHPKSTKEQKIEALKFIVHFVGDAHQPMHISRGEDKGGNSIQVQFDNKGTNLHSLWDSILLDQQGSTVMEMSQQFDRATPEQIKDWQKDQPLQWLFESYELSSKLYAEVEKNNQLGDDYYQSHIGIVEQRIDKGGIRLAGVLNDIYGGKVFAYTFEPPVLVAHITEVTGPAKMIDVKNATAHLNEQVTVTAKVYGTKDVGSMILVNVGAAFPDSPLTVVLRNDTKTLASEIDGKIITVTGKVIDYKGKPEIIVTDKTQLSWK